MLVEVRGHAVGLGDMRKLYAALHLGLLNPQFDVAYGVRELLDARAVGGAQIARQRGQFVANGVENALVLAKTGAARR